MGRTKWKAWKTLAIAPAVLAIVTIMAPPSLAQTVRRYVAVPLPSPGPSLAAGINDAGEVAATLATPGGERAVVWRGTTLTDLGTLGGTLSVARAINARGDVTGYSTVAGDGYYRAFLYTAGLMLDRGGPAGEASLGTTLDDAGNVAGIAGYDTGFVYSATSRLLVPLSGYAATEVVALADNGDFVIVADPNYPPVIPRPPVGNWVAFLRSGSVDTTLPALTSNNRCRLNSSPGQPVVCSPANAPSAINAAGIVTGSAFVVQDVARFGFVRHAYRYRPDLGIVDLGTLPGSDAHAMSFGQSIDDAGVVVGTATYGPGGGFVAFIHDGTAMADLNRLVVAGLGGATLTEATGINNRGQIVANDCSQGSGMPRTTVGSCRAFRLDPIEVTPGDPMAVPTGDMRSWLAVSTLLLGLGGMTLRRRQRARADGRRRARAR